MNQVCLRCCGSGKISSYYNARYRHCIQDDYTCLYCCGRGYINQNLICKTKKNVKRTVTNVYQPYFHISYLSSVDIYI